MVVAYLCISAASDQLEELLWLSIKLSPELLRRPALAPLLAGTSASPPTRHPAWSRRDPADPVIAASCYPMAQVLALGSSPQWRLAPVVGLEAFRELGFVGWPLHNLAGACCFPLYANRNSLHGI